MKSAVLRSGILMILYDLKCASGHQFEAWFRNSDTYDRQAIAGEVACPTCGDTHISKAPMAPRIASNVERTNTEQDIARKLEELRQHVEITHENVGDRFPEEARRIHYGEAERRDIYGHASLKDAVELVDEGIMVLPLPNKPKLDS